MYSSTPVTDRRYATETTDIGSTSMLANIILTEVETGHVSLTSKTLLIHKHLRTQSCELDSMIHRPHCTVAAI